jgi:ABC-type nitrate/sulfonate/bicarbonate transport system permease component
MSAAEAAEVIERREPILPDAALALPLAVTGRPPGSVGARPGARLQQTLTRPAVATAVGMGILVALWWIAAAALAYSHTIATPPEALRSLWDARQLLWEASRTTLAEAGAGFVAGNLVGVGLATAFVSSKLAERAVLQMAIVTHCLPIVAVGPLLELLLTGTQPRIVMSALLVFFPTVVTVQVGLRHTDRTALEIVRVYGGRRRHEMRFVRLMTAVPYILNALKITAPLAMLGAILGEFLGGNGGLGVLIITSQGNDDVARTWAIAIVCTAWSMLAFGLFALVSRVLVPWGPKAGGRS